MSDVLTLSAPDLAALLCSRVCHDIISPVGAINNGLELLDEGGSDEDAMRLIRTSARNASARLQFARIAFGAAGSAGMQIDTGNAEAVASAFLANEKPEFEWCGARALLPKAGPWMEAVKQVFGELLLGVAIWLISPVIPAVAHMLLWSALLIVSAIYLHAVDPLKPDASGFRKFMKGIGMIALLVGVALLANGPLHGMWAAGAVAVGVVLILLGEFFARH